MPLTTDTLNALDAPAKVSAIDNGALSSAPDSPSFDSPSTPSPPQNPVAVNINLSLEYPERESDVRHEPISMDIDKHFPASPTLHIASPQELGMDSIQFVVFI